jgi:hypothetical protein
MSRREIIETARRRADFTPYRRISGPSTGGIWDVATNGAAWTVPTGKAEEIVEETGDAEPIAKLGT